jgi:hypothetical protein
MGDVREYRKAYLAKGGGGDVSRVEGAPNTHRVATAAPPLSGVHSVMMEKLAQAGEGGESTPTPFHYSFHHIQSCSVRSS